MDPAFRLLHALMRARDTHRALGRSLPDWPPLLKDIHAQCGDALGDAWTALWDVYAPDSEYACGGNEEIRTRMADATADTSESLTHVYDPPDNASLKDEPPSLPA